MSNAFFKRSHSKNFLLFQEPRLTGLTVFNYERAKMNGEFAEMSFKNGYIVAHFGDTYIGAHRLVASTFVTNNDRNNRAFVNHMNEIKHDNRAINLEWTTLQENTTFSVSRPVDIVDVSKYSNNVWQFKTLKETSETSINNNRYSANALTEYRDSGELLDKRYLVISGERSSSVRSSIEPDTDSESKIEYTNSKRRRIS